MIKVMFAALFGNASKDEDDMRVVHGELITERYYGPKHPEIKVLDHSDKSELEELLMGRRVTKVNDDHLVLDDGSVLRVVGNVGGCSCGAGDYDLSILNSVANVITKVEFDYDPDSDHEEYRNESFYRIFVYAENEKINLMQFDGSDGNGYYGTGFHILVRPSSGNYLTPVAEPATTEPANNQTLEETP